MNYEERIGDQDPPRRAACYFLLRTVIDDRYPSIVDTVEFATGQQGLTEAEARQWVRGCTAQLGKIAGRSSLPWPQAQAFGIADHYIDAIRERMAVIEGRVPLTSGHDV